MSAPNPTSIATPLMERVVCAVCGHFHRVCIRYRCRCCGADVKKVTGT